jgi:hypothetical protein
MTEQELLVDCLRRLNRGGITYYLTGSKKWAATLGVSSELNRLLSGEIKPKRT